VIDPVSVADVLRVCAAKLFRILTLLIVLLPAVTVAEDPPPLLTVTQRGTILGTFSLAALEATGAEEVTVADDSDRSAAYTGVPMSKLLESVGITLGASVKGKRLAEFVMVRAADGYRALFSLAEIDPVFREHALLLCYRKNGNALPDGEGPLRLVVADEKRHARWVRQVTAIDLDTAQ
jgi:DMSO/TMAO reductase YedYZ molybdopterin-dependent catalytic subunit